MKNLKPWPIDLSIYIGPPEAPEHDWTETELTDYVFRLRDALTSNNNWAHVYWEESNIVVFANAGGDNETFFRLVDEACDHGCWVEIDDGEEWREPTGAEWEEFQKSLIC